jgi:SAM-dependent methyltransferase
MHSAQFELHATLEDSHWWFVARRRIVRKLIDHLLENQGHPTNPRSPHPGPLSKGEGASVDNRPLIIDIGCGTGANIASLSDRYRCVGIDTSTDAIQWAHQRFPRVRFIEGYAPKDLGSLTGEARLITMMDVLEHVKDDFALLSNILAECSPGAYLLLTVPADLSLWSKHDETFGHYRRYDPIRFARLWAGLPVETMLLSHYNSRLYPLIKAARKFNRLFRRSAGECGTDFSLPSKPMNWTFQSIFAGEGEMLFDMLTHGEEGYERGVSLIAVLRRKAGVIETRTKPREAGPDYFDPATQHFLTTSA